LIDEKDYWGTNYKGHDWGIIKQGEYSQTYYATFNAHYYKAHFIDRDNPDYTETVSIQYDPQGKNRFHTNVTEPVPVRPTEDEYRYTLKGWTTTENYGGYYDSGVDVSGYLSNVSTIPVIEDIYLYAVFQLESVYDNPTDSKYFDATEVSIKGVKGWSLYLNTEYYNMTPLKITIPTTFTKIVNNKPVTHTVISLGKFNNANTPLNITHIFLMPDS
jgi:hypothetical protein